MYTQPENPGEFKVNLMLLNSLYKFASLFECTHDYINTQSYHLHFQCLFFIHKEQADQCWYCLQFHQPLLGKKISEK